MSPIFQLLLQQKALRLAFVIVIKRIPLQP